MSDEDTKFWIYAGGLPYELTEGDILCVFSQYGEIFEISLSRDRETGKSRGFCFIKYEDPRSCELAVDNFNGATIIGRRIKVSFANNTNAVKSRKPAIVAPHQQLETSARPRQRDLSHERQNSPKPDERSGDHLMWTTKKRKYREGSHSSDDEIERHSKRSNFNLNSGERARRSESRHDYRRVESTQRSRRHNSNDRHRRRESEDRYQRRGSRDTDRRRHSPERNPRHRHSPERERRRHDSRHEPDDRHKRREPEDRSRHHDSDHKHRNRDSEVRHRHREDSDRKHRHSRHHSSYDRKSHN